MYKVTIVVIDNNGGRGEFDVCIEVRNENEDGEITLVDDSGNEVEQPYAHSRITAVLTDPDGGVNVTGWQWAMSDVNPADANELSDIEMATSASYRPINADEGKFLQVTATYTDLFSTGDMAANVIDVLTTYAVLRGGAEGKDPVFTVDGTEDGLEVPGVEVSVAEGSPAGAYVGAPLLAAIDPDDSTITYELIAAEAPNAGDVEFFELRAVDHDDGGNTPNVNTLQLMVKVPICKTRMTQTRITQWT